MPPDFPNVARVELKVPPLELVVCQVRFPTILELAAGHPPSEFQQRVRATFPAARPQHTEMVLEVQPGTAHQTALSTIWRFDDRDSAWTVSLGSDFLALETKQYRRFEDFISRFMEVLGYVREIYPVDLRERLGLRYLDRIDRQKQPALPANWPAEVRPEVIPLRGLRGAKEQLMSSLETRFTFGDCVLAVRSSYVDNGYAGATSDKLFLDFDCYTEQRGDLDGIEVILREFRQIAYNAFRWCVGDLLRYFERA
jgi:uncharacterized protein (TIGR04255 family)